MLDVDNCKNCNDSIYYEQTFPLGCPCCNAMAGVEQCGIDEFYIECSNHDCGLTQQGLWPLYEAINRWNNRA